MLVVLAHDRRRVVHFNVTERPTAAWTAQQIIEAFPEDTAPRFLLRNRDQIYGEEFRRRVAGMRIEEVMTAPHGLWQSPYVERLIGSIRREWRKHRNNSPARFFPRCVFIVWKACFVRFD